MDDNSEVEVSSDRRSFFRKLVSLAALGAVTGLLTGKAGLPSVRAADGDSLTLGGYNIETNDTFLGRNPGGNMNPGLEMVLHLAHAETALYSKGLLAEIDSTGGIGVEGRTNSPTGFTYGVNGYSKSSDGIGVRGVADASGGIGLAGVSFDPNVVPIVAAGAQGGTQASDLLQWWDNFGPPHTVLGGVTSNGSVYTQNVFGFSTVQQGTSPFGVCISAPDTQSMGLFTNFAESVRINSAGQVGIGITNPAWKLHVAGDGLFDANKPGSLVLGVSNRGSGFQTCGLSASIENLTSLLQTAAIQGNADTATGVYGGSTSGTGVVGASGTGPGVSGSSTSSNGVVGHSNSSCGVYGTAGSVVPAVMLSNVGVEGISSSGIGVGGYTNDGVSVEGSTLTGTGVHGLALGDGAIGVLGQADSATSLSIPIVAKASAIQTANLQEWRNGSDKPLAVVDASGRLGVGTGAPGFNIHAVGTTDPASITVDGIGIVGPNFMFRRARGTTSAPTAVQANDGLLFLVAKGYGSTGFSATGRANISMYAAENWTDAHQGTYMSFKTTQAGTTTQTEKMRITDTGKVGIGTTSPDQALSVSGNADKSSGGTAWGNFCDGRWKDPDSIKPFDLGLDWVKTLPSPVRFRYAEGNGIGADPEVENVNFIAQDLQDGVHDNLVYTTRGKVKATDKESVEMYGVNVNDMHFAMVNAIKQLGEQNQALREEVRLLKSRLDASEQTIKPAAS